MKSPGHITKISSTERKKSPLPANRKFPILKSPAFRFAKWIFSIILFLIIAAYSTSPTKSHRISSSPLNAVSDTVVNGKTYEPISFDLLGNYDYKMPYFIFTTKVNDNKNKIPDTIKSLDGKNVKIRGYFYPTDLTNGGTIKDFLLLRNQIYCCFGDAVNMNEWISVTMSDGKPFKADFTSRPVTLYGKIEVGEKYDNGSLLNLYRMKADKLVED
jgi:hypothetical protein